MNQEDINKYCDLMAEIKRRTNVIDGFSDGTIHAIYEATTIESIYLQFRKILELIVLGSLISNRDEYCKNYQNFLTCWNPKKIIAHIERINPDFYPRPIIQQPSSRPGHSMDFIDCSSNFLTKDEFITLYNQCGAILHTGHPDKTPLDFSEYKGMVPYWRERIMNLLNAHIICLLNDPQLYLIQMGCINELPSYNLFAPSSR